MLVGRCGRSMMHLIEHVDQNDRDHIPSINTKNHFAKTSRKHEAVTH